MGSLADGAGFDECHKGTVSVANSPPYFDYFNRTARRLLIQRAEADREPGRRFVTVIE